MQLQQTLFRPHQRRWIAIADFEPIGVHNRSGIILALEWCGVMLSEHQEVHCPNYGLIGVAEAHFVSIVDGPTYVNRDIDCTQGGLPRRACLVNSVFHKQ